jgi:hypothetical protein
VRLPAGDFLKRCLKAVHDLVPKQDEQLEVQSHGVVVLRIGILDALGYVPTLVLATLEPDELAVTLPVPVVRLVPLELGLQQVQPRSDHGPDEVGVVA